MSKYQVSIIVPIHNGEKWIKQCFESILSQSAINDLKLEICICNDSSTDETKSELEKWQKVFENLGIGFNLFHNESGQPKGGIIWNYIQMGFAKNKAVASSRGEYLCFQDVDDVMFPERIKLQYNTAISKPLNSIVGSKFIRNPENSTARFTNWANNLTPSQLNLQIYTSNGPTVIMPTWFCHRTVFETIGGFSEKGHGVPEDLIFFYKHLDLGGQIYRVDDFLLQYTYHPVATTFSIDEKTIWNIRLERLERIVLNEWAKFTIWNAGKQGRKFYNSLKTDNKNKVQAMCDVDVKKIGKYYTPFDEKTRTTGRNIPIINYKNASPPFVICVKMDLTDGQFESNLNSLNLIENVDYVLFS